MPDLQPRSVLSDFIGKEVYLPPPPPQDLNIDQVKVVDARKPDVAKAQPILSPYWVKYKTRTLTPADVTGYPSYSNDVTKFKDISAIEADKERPASKRLFYGPGVEHDSV